MLEHLTSEILCDYAEGLLETVAKATVESHLQYCTTCQRELKIVQGYFQEVSSLSFEKAPADFLNKIHSRIHPMFSWRHFWRLEGLNNLGQKIIAPWKLSPQFAGVFVLCLAGILVYTLRNNLPPENITSDQLKSIPSISETSAPVTLSAPMTPTAPVSPARTAKESEKRSLPTTSNLEVAQPLEKSSELANSIPEVKANKPIAVPSPPAMKEETPKLLAAEPSNKAEDKLARQNELEKDAAPVGRMNSIPSAIGASGLASRGATSESMADRKEEAEENYAPKAELAQVSKAKKVTSRSIGHKADDRQINSVYEIVLNLKNKTQMYALEKALISLGNFNRIDEAEYADKDQIAANEKEESLIWTMKIPSTKGNEFKNLLHAYGKDIDLKNCIKSENSNNLIFRLSVITPK